jgi:hypothetical protein
VLPIVLKDKLTILDEKFEKKEELKYEIYSKEFGIIIMDGKKIYRYEPVFDTNYELMKEYHGYNLLLDTTTYCKDNLVSQLPVNYILTPLTSFEYKQNSKSKLKMIVSCITETHEFSKELIPIDFYFFYNMEKLEEIHDLLNNKFFQEEFNVFLSHLN